MKKLFFGIGVFLALGFVAANNALALKVDPSLLSIALNGGESKTMRVKFINDAALIIGIKPKLYSAFAGNNETGFPTYVPAQADDTLANWITFADSKRLSLKPNETKEIDVTVAVPFGAAPGGHYAGIGWGILADANAGEGNVSVSGEIMTNVALDVPGVVQEKGDIVSFATVDEKTTYDHLPIGFSVRVANTGNRHFKPVGAITVRDMFGRITTTIPINDGIGGGNVLPNSTREFKATWKEGFALGNYTATTNLVLGGAGDASASYSFWVLPTMLLTIWAIIALVIVVILVMVIRSVARRKKK